MKYNKSAVSEGLVNYDVVAGPETSDRVREIFRIYADQPVRHRFFGYGVVLDGM